MQASFPQAGYAEERVRVLLYRGAFRKNNDNMLIFASMFSLLLLLTVTVYSFKALFLNMNNDRQSNNLLYAKVLNNSMPIVEVTSFEEENMAEEKISIGGELLKLLGLDVNNPMSIMGREVSLFKNVDYNDAASAKTNNVVLNFNSFELQPGQVSSSSPSAGEADPKSNTSGSTNTSGGSDSNNAVTVYNPNLKKNLDTSKPEVLIYHTHTTESYAPGGNYEDEPSKNVCAVGDVLASELESKYGISVAHDKTVHNTNFNESYSRSRETVDKYINKYGDFKLIIDMHRDSVYSKSSITSSMNGENVAKIMFVMTKKNPHYDKNAGVVNGLEAISDKIFPGFCRGTYYYNYGSKYFNQDKSNNAVLIEVGASINTLDESKASGKYMARIIAEYLNGKK